jgi:YidC/Oxa1 family membrane protein insertase
MNSSRSTIIGIGLIMLVFFAWMIYNQPKKVPPVAPKPTTAADTTAASPQAQAAISQPTDMRSAVIPTDTSAAQVTKYVETPLVSAIISSHGGNVVSWVLKKYKTYMQAPLEMVDHTVHTGDVNLDFVASDGKKASTKDLYFTIEDNAQKTLGYHDSTTIRMIAHVDSAGSIEKLIHIYSDNYTMRIEYKLNGLATKVAGYRYSLSADNPIPYNEKHADDESGVAKAIAMMKSGAEEIDANKVGEPVHKTFNGDVEYVATRTKYFLQALIPVYPRPVTTDMSGTAVSLGEAGHMERYAVNVSVPITSAAKDSIAVNYYLGPLEYYRLDEMTPPLTGVMDFGWSFLVRPISIYILFPFFMWLHGFIANWGLVIIVFSIVIKLVTMPFSKSQMAAMRKMQALAPIMNEMKEKHKDDPKKQQEETFKLYRTYGVNPAGGCLPLILQMPILFALYAVLRNVIELRQAPFFGWINDLSVPDGLIKFGGHVPILGEQLSGLTLLMGATMLIQSIFQTTDPKQKTMAYIMPIMMTVLFNNLPSGVALYYFMFNVFGILQQLYNKKFLPPLDLEELKRTASNKKGLMSKLQDMEKSARNQRQSQMAGGQLPGRKKKK